ncbi:predicted protein [Uncinocarpus reesii 1704]|uniref:Replication protein A C-terminal domain-containing protein n=1 Tax=Uncinocarpus reesii (strain UAMH 1704) TaxID=336963 RepID=C4JDF0_UNCRE|nr:uncharacterized protein UREG_00315 [Uncinocarpus reesii 1704]EEP75469.1 predicted protein [Uncinocarpus reesii 1704]
MNEVGSSQSGKKATKESLRPVTIKQLNDATQAYTDAEFKIDDTEITQVSFVGQVRNISQLSTFTTYKLDDGTGEIEVKRWLDRSDGMQADPMDTDSAATKRPDKNQIVTNGYVKVWGKLSSYSNNRRSVTAVVIRPLTSMDEYHCHFLEATSIHLYFTRGPPPNKDKPEAGKGQGSGMTVTGKPLPALSPMGTKLYEALSNTLQSREGLHVQQLASMLNASTSDVRKTCDELAEQGLIFTTVDEFTWAVMEF